MLLLFAAIFSTANVHSQSTDSAAVVASQKRIEDNLEKAGKHQRRIDKSQKRIEKQQKKINRQERKREKKMRRIEREQKKMKKDRE